MKRIIALCIWLVATGAAFALEPAPEPSQTLCPVSGRPVDGSSYVDVEGFRILTAGPKEAEAVLAHPSRAFAALAASGEAAIPVNRICPSMGFAVGLNFPYIQQGGKRIYYCCAPCGEVIAADFDAAARIVEENASLPADHLATARP